MANHHNLTPQTSFQLDRNKNILASICCLAYS